MTQWTVSVLNRNLRNRTDPILSFGVGYSVTSVLCCCSTRVLGYSGPPALLDVDVSRTSPANGGGCSCADHRLPVGLWALL